MILPLNDICGISALVRPLHFRQTVRHRSHRLSAAGEECHPVAVVLAVEPAAVSPRDSFAYAGDDGRISCSCWASEVNHSSCGLALRHLRCCERFPL
jgi:hypothetical protein